MGQTGSRAKSLAKTKKPKEDKKADENDSSSSARRVVKLIESVEEEEGLGAKVQRTIGCEEVYLISVYFRIKFLIYKNHRILNYITLFHQGFGAS